MIKVTKITGIILVFLFVLSSLTFCEEEEFTITTYYPSPYGSYNELTTYSNTYLATGSGKVGIGTSSPGQKLSVAGTIESTSGGIKFPDGTTQTTAAAKGTLSCTTRSTNTNLDSLRLGSLYVYCESDEFVTGCAISNITGHAAHFEGNGCAYLGSDVYTCYARCCKIQ